MSALAWPSGRLSILPAGADNNGSQAGHWHLAGGSLGNRRGGATFCSSIIRSHEDRDPLTQAPPLVGVAAFATMQGALVGPFV